MDRKIQEIARLYPSFVDRIYVKLRLLILPVEKIEKYLPPKGTILDVGCGFGLTTIYFKLKSPVRLLVGLEIDDKRVKRAILASQKISGIKFKKDHLLGREKLLYNAITAVDLFHHLSSENKQLFLSQTKKHLKKSGLLIIKDIDVKPRFKYLWNFFHDKLMTCFAPLYFLSSNDMKLLLNNHGFRIIEIKYIANFFYPHIIYVAQK